jgi:ribosomal protein S3
MDLSFRFLNEFLNLKFRNFFGDGFVNFKFYFSSNAGLGFTDLSLISRYVVYKLYNRFSLYESARPFLYNLLRIPYVKGFFVVGNGRFTRKQRAFYIKHCVGKLSFSAVSAVLYYTFSKVKTKYGMCGVHLWVNYDSSFVNRVRVKLL